MEELCRVFLLDDVDAIHKVLVDEITRALDIVAPEERLVVKETQPEKFASVDTVGHTWLVILV